MRITRRGFLIGSGATAGVLAVAGGTTAVLLSPKEVVWAEGAAPNFPHIPAKPGDHVVVVGGGIVGTSSALNALQRGLKVTIIAPRAPRGRTSFGNAGVIAIGDTTPMGTPSTVLEAPSYLLDSEHPLIIRPSYALDISPYLTRFILASTPEYVRSTTKALTWILGQSYQAHRELATAAGAIDRINPLGYIKVFRGEDAFNAFKAGDLQYSLEQGLPVDYLNAGDLREMEPGLSHDYTHAALYPNSGSVHLPGDYLAQLEEYAARLGATFIHEKVTTFRREGQKVLAAVTPTQEVAADHFIVAAGAWSKPLAAELGADIPLDTERGYHVMTPAHDDEQRVRRAIYYSDLTAYSTPMEDHVRVTTGEEFAGLLAEPDYHLIDRKVKAVAGVHAGVGEATQDSHWMGFRPSVPDSRPVIGHAPDFANAHLAFGHGHLGLTMGPITGKLIVESMFAARPRLELAAFSPERFA